MRWYRSLYWRIAFGVVAFLAAMLVVQAMLFVWAVSQSGRSLPGGSPGRLGMSVALDLANLLERDPQADLAQYIREQYASYAHPFFVLLDGDRVITSGSASFPEPFLRMAKARLERLQAAPRPDMGSRGGGPPPFGAPRRGGGPPGGFGPGDRFSGSDRFGPGDRFGAGERFERSGDRIERDAEGVRFVRPSPIVAGGHVVGVVVVPPQAPFGFLLGRWAPTLALVAVGVLVVGGILTSVMIFGPARRRLRQLETRGRQ